MTFAVFVPDHAAGARLPVLFYLSGLTCTHANVMEKGEYRAACAAAGIIFVCPDTSPRGEGVPDDDGYDFGTGAGFYVNATQAPWATHFRMRDYIENELPALIAAEFPGGYGAAGDHRPFDGRAWRADDFAAQSGPVPLDQRLCADCLAAQLPVGREGAGRLSRAGPGGTGANMMPAR